MRRSDHDFPQPLRIAGFAAGGSPAVVFGLGALPSAAESARVVPPPALDEAAGQATSEDAVFAGGCFWGVQGVFQHVEGVTNAVSGYAGGDKATAQYDMVGSGRTGHAEVGADHLRPAQGQLRAAAADLFLGGARSDELNRQGPDIGTQYRSTIFPTNAEQARGRQGLHRPARPGARLRQAIVTTIEPGQPFYPAEDYHQDYLTLHPSQPYIAINDLPKVENLKRLFPEPIAPSRCWSPRPGCEPIRPSPDEVAAAPARRTTCTIPAARPIPTPSRQARS